MACALNTFNRSRLMLVFRKGGKEMNIYISILLVMVILFSVTLAGYIAFFKTAIESRILKITLSAFLSLCIFLVTSMLSLIVLWPPM